MSEKFVGEFRVVDNITLNSTNFLIELQANISLPDIKPGQFANIEISNSKDIFLRRPFSIFEVDYKKNTLSIIVKILGRGSKALTKIKIGDIVNMIYPLGRGFTLPEFNDKVLMIGGGSGIAPIIYLAKESGINKDQVDILIGARSKEDHIDVSEYKKFGNLAFTTEDGSMGEKGFVTAHSAFLNVGRYDKIYACGPEAMMKAIAHIAQQNNIFCEVSLENLMACGFGVCLCCIEPTINGNVCVCTEGPVFNVNNLQWQI